jgi:hypothetical protein
MGMLEDFYDNFDYGHGPPLVAVAPNDVGLGMENGDLIDNGEQPLAQISVSNLLRGAAHEIGHMFGLPHASNECRGGQDNDADDIGQVGEPWSPDGQGFIGGVGLDPFVASPFPVIGPGASPATSQDFDFMSYCASGDPGVDLKPAGTAWISVRNWDYLVTFAACVRAGGSGDTCKDQAQAAKFVDSSIAPVELAHASPDVARASDSLRAQAAAGPGYTRVYGYEDRAGTTLALIDPTVSTRRLTGIASRFGLEAIGPGGHVLARTKMLMHPTHADGPGGGPILLLQGAVPTHAGATAIAITEGGKVVAIRQRPSHRPRVRLLAPKTGARLRVARPLLIRWRATDPGRLHLTVSIDFSADGGRTWRMIAIVANSGRATVPGSYLTASKRSRIRLRVNDGFDEITVTSGRLTVTGGR